MIPAPIVWAALAVLMISSLALLLSENWRWMLVLLAIQYLASFGLVVTVWPVGLAAVKLVVGWMAGAVLGSTQAAALVGEDELSGISGRLFRLMAAGMLWILVFSIAGPLQNRIPAAPPVLMGGLILMGIGLLHLSLTTKPLRMIVGLLTFMAGFEILYAAIESSVLVAGLLGVVNLGMALIGAYVMLSSSMEEPA